MFLRSQSQKPTGHLEVLWGPDRSGLCLWPSAVYFCLIRGYCTKLICLLLPYYAYMSGRCRVQLISFYKPLRSKRIRMPCLYIILFFLKTERESLASHQVNSYAKRRHLTSHLIFQQHATRGSAIKGLFKGQKLPLLKTVCSLKCIHKVCHSLSCVL